MYTMMSMLALPALALAIHPEGSIDGPPDDARPLLRVEEASFDWGAVVEGDVVRHGFTLHNDGSAVLLIEEVRAACGCTSVEAPAAIAPGASGTVTLELDTDGMVARSVHKTARVTSNDPDRPQVDLVLSGALTPIVDVEPRQVELAGRRSDRKRAVVTVEPAAGFALDVSNVRPVAGRITVLEVRRSETAGRYDVILEAPPADVAGEQRDVLRLPVVGPDGVARERRVPVHVRHEARVRIASKALFFSRSETARAGEGDRAAARAVTVHATAPEVSFRITGVELEGLSSDLFRASLSTDEEGRRYTVTVECIGGHDRPIARGELRVLTDDPEVPSLSIPVLAQFSSADDPAPPVAEDPTAERARSPR